MAAPVVPMDVWLTERLLAASQEVDLEIFVPYVTGILDTDTSIEDKKESLEEVLEEVVEKSGEKDLCTEIINQWEVRNTENAKESSEKSEEDLSMKLSNMIGNSKVDVVKTRVLTEEEKARKAAIIAQYEELSDGENDGETEEHGAKAAAVTSEDWVTRNMNSLSVLEAEKEKRDKSKQEYERKKEKDRVDREAQKQKQVERKDAEKKRTQKGEKRR